MLVLVQLMIMPEVLLVENYRTIAKLGLVDTVVAMGLPYMAYGLVSVSYHWNNLLWPLVITNSVSTRPLTVGLQVFSSPDQGGQWSIISAAALMTSAPLLIGFLLFQRQFVQSFMRAGIK